MGLYIVEGFYRGRLWRAPDYSVVFSTRFLRVYYRWDLVAVAAKGGADHHFVVKANADKARVLEQVAAGVDLDAALALVGRKRVVLRRWLEDAKFAAALEDAQGDAQRLLESTLAGGKFAVDFATFSREFLNSEVFPHHQSWIDVLEGREPSWLHEAMTYESGNPKRLLINVPPEHAKSTVVTVGYATYRIAMDPNVRIVIVSQTQTRAKEFLYSIKQRLTEEPWAKLQSVYGPPGGYQATADQWTADRIYLQRASGEKDPTVQAIGMGQQIYGTRADIIILDDVVTTSNAHEWEKQLNWLQKMVITRVGATGSLIVVGTRVSSIDLYKELRNPDHWSGGRSPFTYLAMPAVLEFADNRKDWVTLWPRSDRPWDGADEDWMLEEDENGHFVKWDGRTLFQRRAEVNPATWALVYQQEDVEEDAVFSPVLVNDCTNRLRRAGPLQPGKRGHPDGGEWVTIMGLDPAMVGKTAAIVYAFERNTGYRMVLDVYNMHDPTPAKIRGLIEEWAVKYRPLEVRIEINAFQKAFALDEDLRQWLATRGIQLREHFTGKNKWDSNFGVASMSALFGYLRDGEPDDSALIELPSPENNEHVKALIQQLITWKPDTKNPTDCVMALWFCEIRAKELINHGTHRTHHMPNRYATMRNNMNQTVVNLDELYSEQNVIYI